MPGTLLGHKNEKNIFKSGLKEFVSLHLCRFYTSYMQTVYKLVSCNCHLFLRFFFFSIIPIKYILNHSFSKCLIINVTRSYQKVWCGIWVWLPKKQMWGKWLEKFSFLTFLGRWNSFRPIPVLCVLCFWLKISTLLTTAWKEAQIG